ncbi:MAG: DUF5654 family protein [Planctomycetes bacterium]|jgi:hypothetical protein|nr:DUF5654 family protein [Planctomycetota bacterium]
MDKEKLKIEKEKIYTEAFNKINELAVAALGLIAALAWNEAIKSLFNVLFPRPEDSLIAQFLYAIFITILIVILSIVLARSFNRVKKLMTKNSSLESSEKEGEKK